MSVLSVEVGGDGVTALAVGPDGAVRARGHREVVRQASSPDWVEQAPEDVWRATLASVEAVLQQVGADELRAIGVTGRPDTVLLWDRETLGSPRPASATPDRRPAAHVLARLAEHDPHTWALVVSGRYAVGTVDSYLVARMTRGTWHVTDPSTASRTGLLDLGTGDWSDALCSGFGVPREALPELVPSWGRAAVTDARSFLDLSLPVSGLVGDRSAALVGAGCLAAGDVLVDLGAGPTALTVIGSTPPTPMRGSLAAVAWGAPSGQPTFALEASCGDDDPSPAQAVRELLSSLPPSRSATLHVAGPVGDAGCQVLADEVGVPVERSPATDTSALGAALLAGLGAGTWSSLEQLRDLRPAGRVFVPTAGG